MNTLQRSHKKSKANKKKTSLQDDFQREWDRVQRLQKQNEKLVCELDQLTQRVRSEVGPIESKRVELLSQLNTKLIQFVGRRTLPEYMRLELLDWIQSDLREIQANPLAQNNDVSKQIQELEKQFAALNEFEEQKLEKRLLKQGFSQEEIDEARNFAEERRQAEEEYVNDEVAPEMDDLFEELFGDDDDEAWDEEMEERIFREHFDQREADLKTQDNQLNQLLKATPLSGLFRKIARVLHPDLETDEQKKQDKHQQMSKLLHARDQKDIFTIIQMYIEHVGNLPENAFDGNFDKLTELLKHQVQKLRHEKEELIYQDPVKGIIYDLFYGKSERDVAKNIRNHIQETRRHCTVIESVLHDITSVPRLREHLEQRAMQWAYDEPGDIPF